VKSIYLLLDFLFPPSPSPFLVFELPSAANSTSFIFFKFSLPSILTSTPGDNDASLASQAEKKKGNIREEKNGTYRCLGLCIIPLKV